MRPPPPSPPPPLLLLLLLGSGAAGARGRSLTVQPPLNCQGSGAFINFRCARGVIFANCQEFSFKGMNWFGSESEARVVQGLDVHSLDWYFSFLANHSFNSVRLLFNHEAVLANKVVPHDQFSWSHNSELVDATYLEFLCFP